MQSATREASTCERPQLTLPASPDIFMSCWSSSRRCMLHAATWLHVGKPCLPASLAPTLEGRCPLLTLGIDSMPSDVDCSSLPLLLSPAALTVPRCTPTGRQRRSWAPRSASWDTPAASMSCQPRSSSARVRPTPCHPASAWPAPAHTTRSLHVAASTDRGAIGRHLLPPGLATAAAAASERHRPGQRWCFPGLVAGGLPPHPTHPPHPPTQHPTTTTTTTTPPSPHPSPTPPPHRQQRAQHKGAVPQAHHRGHQGWGTLAC